MKGIREGKETSRQKQPNLLPAKLKSELKTWRDRLKAAKQAAKDAELARFEGEGGALAPGKKGPTDEQRLKSLEKMLDRQISELTGDLAAGRLGPKETKAAPTSPALESKKATLATLKEVREQARQADPA